MRSKIRGGDNVKTSCKESAPSNNKILSSKKPVVKSKTLCKIKLLCETIKHYCKGILCILLGAKVAWLNTVHTTSEIKGLAPNFG